MSVYLRFSPAEYQALRAACRPLDFHNDLLPLFRSFLKEALTSVSPELAGRVAQLRKREIRLLFRHFQEQRGAHVPARADRARLRDLSAEEWQTLARVASPYALPPGFPHVFRDFLVVRLAESAPDLSKKLCRLSDAQVELLHARIKVSGRGRV